MSRRVNIEGRVPIRDPHYRYTMPALQVQYEKSWSILPNLVHVGNALHRDSNEILKYMTVELCSSGGYKDGRLALKGRMPLATLQKLLRNYIQDFCLCAKCHLPETAYRVRHGKVLLQKCSACGAKVRMLDPDHKVCTHILQEFVSSTRHRQKKPTAPVVVATRTPKKTQKETSTIVSLRTKKTLEATKMTTKNKERKGGDHYSSSSDETKKEDITVDNILNETVDAVLASSPSSTKEWTRSVIREVRCSGPFLTSKDNVRVLLHAWFQSRSSVISASAGGSAGASKIKQLPIDGLRLLLDREEMMRRYVERYLVESLEEVFMNTLKGTFLHAITFVQWLKSIWEEDLVDQEILFSWGEDKTTLVGIDHADHCRLVKASRPLLIWLSDNEEEQDASDEEGSQH